MGKKGGKDYQRNKIDPIIGKNNGFKINIYYHIIYQC